MIRTITTQTEWDALPKSFAVYTVVEIRCGSSLVVVSSTPVNGRVVARGNSNVEAWGNSNVEAWENSNVVARENSNVEARENSNVEAWGNSNVEAWGNSNVVARENSNVEARGNSNVEAWGNSNVEARGNSNVEAWGNSNVEAWENSNVVARENSNVEARGNSNVEARGNSNVEARGNSNVEAWGNSNVEAWENSNVVARENSNVVARENSNVVARENSNVEAWGNVCVRAHSDLASVLLFGFSVCYAIAKAKITLKKKTARVIRPKNQKGVAGWLDKEGVEPKNGSVVVFKRVSKDFQTQENTSNATTWTPGLLVEHPNWKPAERECGAGKFHACSTGYFCNEFRNVVGDRYVAVQVKVADLFAWDGASYPHKIAFRKGKVLFECTKFGKQVA